MRRTDDVFFFTLIDFLLQIAFFGVLLFVFQQTASRVEQSRRAAEEAKKNELLAGAGVSDLTELTDMLTRMAPLDQLRGTSDFIATNGGVDKVKAAANAASEAGGIDKFVDMAKQVKLMTARISQLEGYGKPSCLPYVSVSGHPQPKTIAKVQVEDNVITMTDPTPEMQTLLTGLGTSYDHVQRLSLAEFKATFAPVVAKQPDCRYFLSLSRKTALYEPVQTVWTAFRTQ